MASTAIPFFLLPKRPHFYLFSKYLINFTIFFLTTGWARWSAFKELFIKCGYACNALLWYLQNIIDEILMSFCMLTSLVKAFSEISIVVPFIQNQFGLVLMCCDSMHFIIYASINQQYWRYCNWNCLRLCRELRWSDAICQLIQFDSFTQRRKISWCD